MSRKAWRRSRRFFKLTLTRSLFLGFASLVLILLSVIWWFVRQEQFRQAETLTKTQLTGALSQADAELRAWFEPIDRTTLVLRDWVVSGVATTADRIALNQQFLPILRGNPQFLSIRVARNDGFEYWLFQEADLWRTRTIPPEKSGKECVWTKWTKEGTTLLQEEAEPSAYDPRNETWYQEAVARCRNRADRNREGRPAAYWSPPRTREDQQYAVMDLAIAIPGANNAQAIVQLELRVDDLEDISAQLFATRNTPILIAHPDGVALGLPGRKRLRTQDTPILIKTASLVHPLARAYEAWQRRASHDNNPFTFEDADTTWWNAFQVFPLSADAFLYFGAGVPEKPLTARDDFDEHIFGGVMAGGLILSGFLAFGMGRGVRRPVKLFVRRIRGLDVASPFGVSRGSIIAEFNELAEACDEMACLLEERVHELSRLGVTPEEENSPHSAPRCDDEIDSLPPGDHRAGAQASPIQTEENAPQAFLFAMRTTRRRLRAAEDKLDVLNAAVHSQTERLRAYEERLHAQREALHALARYEQEGKITALPEAMTLAVDTAFTVLTADRVSVWERQGAGESYICGPCACSEFLTEYEEKNFDAGNSAVLMRTLSVEDVVHIRDIHNDPRIRAWPFMLPKPESILLIPVREAERIIMLLCVENARQARQWHADEENFACMIAYRLGQWRKQRP